MTRKILRDDQWGRIERMLPGKASDCGVTAKDNRLLVGSVLWVARTGSPWRDLPDEFGNWNSAYKRFARWSDTGAWQGVFAEPCTDADFEEAAIDSTIVRAHQHAAGAPKKGRPGAWALAWRVERQGACGGLWPWAIGKMVPDGRPSA